MPSPTTSTEIAARLLSRDGVPGSPCCPRCVNLAARPGFVACFLDVLDWIGDYPVDESGLRWIETGQARLPVQCDGAQPAKSVLNLPCLCSQRLQ